jgi:predicted nucleic acid-binding protein
VILDSCFLIDVMARDDAALAKREELRDDPRPICVSTPSITDVERGLDAEDRLRIFRSTVEDMSVVPFDHRTARTAADLLRTLDDRGEPIGTLDALVAATALVRGDPVVTRNVSEFDRVDGLAVSPY